MHSVIFTTDARAEFVEAYDWYQREASGLGRQFREAVDELVDRMSSNPRQFPVVYKSVHRALMRRFPYSLFFVMDNDELLVIACFHASRDPSLWRRRT